MTDDALPLDRSVPASTMPSLLNNVYRELYLADEAYAAGPDDSTRPLWLRRDYRQFLSDAIDAAGFSLRGIATWLDKSPATITYLLKPSCVGKRRRITFLSGPLLQQIAHGLALPDDEIHLLRLLVNLEASRRSGEGDPALFVRLIEQAWLQDTGYLPHEKALAYTRDFLNIAVREMVGLRGFSAEPEWLRNHLLYPLAEPPTVPEAARAWQRLVDLGVVEQAADGRWVRGEGDVIVASGSTDRAQAIKTFFRLTLQAASDALELASFRRRFEARTVSLARDGLDRIAQEFETLLDGIAESPDGTGDQVMHVMLLAFPVADVCGRPPEVS